MQKGFATLEIILAIMIIGVLMKFAVPKAAQILDAAALDYETKRFYSELRFVQAMSIAEVDHPVLFIDRTKNCYQVFKEVHVSASQQPIREPHYFSDGVTIKLDNNTNQTITINFDSEGKAKIPNVIGSSYTLILTSRLGKKKSIVFDSVGRIMGSPNK